MAEKAEANSSGKKTLQMSLTECLLLLALIFAVSWIAKREADLRRCRRIIATLKAKEFSALIRGMIVGFFAEPITRRIVTKFFPRG